MARRKKGGSGMECIKCHASFEKHDKEYGDHLDECCQPCVRRALAKRDVVKAAHEKRDKARR